MGLKASQDILINNAENSLHYEISYHKEGEVFSSSKSEHNKIDATEVVGSTIAGGKSVTIVSGNNTEVLASTLFAGKLRETSDEEQANISIHSGGEYSH